MKIEVFLDTEQEPRYILSPPERFEFDTTGVDEGSHSLRFVAIEGNRQLSVRTVSFDVQNGPSIDVHGIRDGDKLSGTLSVLANAYGSSVGDAFEVIRIETPAPIPIWAWVLLLVIVGWGVGYLSLTWSERQAVPALVAQSAAQSTDSTGASAEAGWVGRGEQVYGNNCASCHQQTGAGLPGIFPPLAGSPAVADDDPAAHIDSILHGLTGKVIDGVAYASPMPPFGTLLTDEDVAAVVNHERTQWGNSGRLVDPAEVAARR